MRTSKCKYQVDIPGTPKAKCIKGEWEFVLNHPEYCTEDGCKDYNEVKLRIFEGKKNE